MREEPMFAEMIGEGNFARATFNFSYFFLPTKTRCNSGIESDEKRKRSEVGACAVVRSGAKQHFACVRVSKESKDSECRVDRTNGKLLVRCWCKSGDYCNVDLSERVEDPETDNRRNSIEDEDEDYVLPTTESNRQDDAMQVEETYDINDANYPISSEDFDEQEENTRPNPAKLPDPRNSRNYPLPQNPLVRPPIPTPESNVTTIPPWRREYPIAQLGDQRRILPPPSYSQSQTQQRPQSHPIQSHPYQQNSRQNSQLQNQPLQGYGKLKTRFRGSSEILAPPPRSQPLPLPPARVSTTTARSSTPSRSNQRAYEEIMREYRRRSELQKLELIRKSQVDSRRSFADTPTSRGSYESPIPISPPTRQDQQQRPPQQSNPVNIRPPLVSPVPSSTIPGPARNYTSTARSITTRTYRPFDLNNPPQKQNQKPISFGAVNASIVYPPGPPTRSSSPSTFATRPSVTSTTTLRTTITTPSPPTTTEQTTVSKTSSTTRKSTTTTTTEKPTVPPTESVDVSGEDDKDGFRQYAGEYIYQIEEVQSESTTKATSAAPRISKAKVNKYKEILRKKDKPDAASTQNAILSILVSLIAIYLF
ncbi:hypothetical protein WR25_12017 [Diploscapter pachys]|uniref:Uncharacterized protein n=1 Tax=Diploscapter pachys TaxID=2018661 RepID=A0A2A2J8G8_9BILA|nr:hypothetical protein WR25_12017 [Diploscapter pachys]